MYITNFQWWQVNFDGGFKFNDYPVKFTGFDEEDKQEKEMFMTIEMPLDATEILYGPIHLSWQVFLINDNCFDGCTVFYLNLYYEMQWKNNPCNHKLRNR